MGLFAYLFLVVLVFALCSAFPGFEEQGTLSSRSSWLLTAGDQLWSRALAAPELWVRSRGPQASVTPRHALSSRQGLKPRSLRWQVDPYPLYHQGSPVAAISQEFLLDESLLVVSYEQLGLLKHLERTWSTSLICKLGSLRAASFPWVVTNLNDPADLTELLTLCPCHWPSGTTVSCGCQYFLLSQGMFNPLPKLV